MRKYANITEVKDANKGIGHHFFDRDTMRFFNSRVEGGILKGCYFITSERYDTDRPKEYTVRIAHEDGQVDTVYEFQAFGTRADAKEAINDLPAYFQDALRVAKKAFNTGNYNEFRKHLIQEPDLDTFCGACAWLIENAKKLDIYSWTEALKKGA
jgi:hypothetical protein